jgi:hypothetical protein
MFAILHFQNPQKHHMPPTRDIREHNAHILWRTMNTSLLGIVGFPCPVFFFKSEGTNCDSYFMTWCMQEKEKKYQWTPTSPTQKLTVFWHRRMATTIHKYKQQILFGQPQIRGKPSIIEAVMEGGTYALPRSKAVFLSPFFDSTGKHRRAQACAQRGACGMRKGAGW